MSVFDLPSFSTPTLLPPPSVPSTGASRVPTSPDDQPNAFVAGLKSGSYGLAAGAAGFGSNIAKLVGADDTSASLGQAAAGFEKDAQTVGRPDLDKQSLFSSSFLPKLAYGAGQFLPGVAAIGGAALAAPIIAPEAAVGGAAALGAEAVEGGGLAARIGSLVPKFLGGGGADAAANATLGKAIIGGSAASIPMSIGDLTNQQAEQPGGLTYGGAAKAFGLGIPSGIAGALAPGEGSVLARGAEAGAKTVASNFVDHGLKNAALGAIGGGIQAAASQAVNDDPNSSLGDKASAVVQGVVSGAALGGLIGGVSGALGQVFSKGSTADQSEGITKTLADQGYNAADPSAAAPAPEPTPPAGPAGGGEAATPPAPAPDAPTAAAPDTPQAAVATAEPPKTLIAQVLQDAGITKFSSKGDLGKFVEASTAQTLPELYNEIDSVGGTTALAGTKMFAKLADHLGVGHTDLEEQLAKAKTAETPDQSSIDKLNIQLAVRDAARALRPPEPAPAEVMPTAAEEAPAGVAAAGASPIPREAAAGRMITAPTYEGTIPELGPSEVGTSPAVPTDTQIQPTGGVTTLGPELTAPLPPLAAAGDAGLERAPAPGEVRPAGPDAGVTPGPLSNAEKVLAVARSAVGNKGGEVDIASIRAALPDLHVKDIDTALREIHGDDSENTLTQNPKGQRAATDSVKVDGQGRFQKLELPPQEGADAAEVGSAAPEAGADQPGSPEAAGGGDAPGDQVTRAGEVLSQEAGQPGPADPASVAQAPPPELDPTVLARDGTLTADSANGIADALKTRQTAIENAVLGENADKWRRLNKQLDSASNRGAAGDAMAARAMEGIGQIEGELSPADQGRLYGVGDTDHTDPEDWRNLADRLSQSEGDRDGAKSTIASAVQELPTDPNNMTVQNRNAIAAIQHAMSTESARGGDPMALLKEGFGERAGRAGSDGAELSADDMSRMRALMGSDAPAVEAPKPAALPPPENDFKSTFDLKPHVEADARRFDNGYHLAGDVDHKGRPFIHQFREVFEGKLAKAQASVDRYQKRLDTAIATGQDPRIKGPLGEGEVGQNQIRRALESSRSDLEYTQAKIGQALPEVAGTPPAAIRQAAQRVKLAPAPEVEATPAQQAQTAVKTKAVANILAADPTVSKAGTEVVQKLRKQSRAKTAMIETPSGDQVPTEGVGGTPVDLAQATAPSTDPIADAGKPQIMPKMPSDRMAGVSDTHPVLPLADVTAHVDRFRAKVREDLRGNIHTVATAADLPEALRQQGADEGHDFSTNSGVYHNNQVYIIADQMRNRGEIEDTLSHEIWGHLGTAQRFARASDFGSAMSGIFDKIDGPEGGGFERAARKAGVWDQFDDGHNLNGGSGIKDYMPNLFPDGMDRATPMQKAIAMDELIAHKAGTNPSKFDDLVSSIQVQAKRAITNTLRRVGMSNFAKRFDTFGQPELAKWVADSRAALRAQPRPGDIDLAALSSDPRQFIHDSDPLGAAPFMSRVSGQQRDVQGAMGLAGSVLQRVVDSKAYEKMILGPVRGFKSLTAPASEMAETAKRVNMPGIADNYAMNQPRHAMETRWNQTHGVVHQTGKQLSIADRVQYDRANKLAAIVTGDNIKVNLPFEAHTWLIDGKTPEQISRSRAQYDVARGLWNDLGNATKGGKKTNGQQVFLDHATAGEANWHMTRASAMHDFLSTTGLVDKDTLGAAPIERYAGLDPNFTEANALHGDIHGSARFAENEYTRLNEMARSVSNGAGTLKENLDTPLYNELKEHIENNDNGQREQVKQGTYFHQGRQGDHIFSGYMKPELDADGKPTGRTDPAALEAIRSYVDKNFPQVSIGRTNTNNAIFSKFDTGSMAARFHKAFSEGGPLWEHMDQEKGTSTRLISDAPRDGGSIPGMERQTTALAAQYDAELSKMTPGTPEYTARAAEKTAALGTLRASINDLLGDGSARALQSRRENVQGFNADMLAAQQHPSATTAKAVADLAVQQRKANGLASARAAIDESARRGDAQATERTARMQRVYDDFQKRDDASSKRVANSYLSWVKTNLHSFQLAASPAYAIMNISQIGTLGLPELARFHGYAKSMYHLARSLPEATKMMGALIAKLPQADGTIGRSIAYDGINNAVLDRGSSSPAMRAFHEAMANRGAYELGSFTANDSGTKIGALSRAQRWLHYANQIPLMAETFCRVLTGITAKRLYDNLPAGAARTSMTAVHASAEDYASHVINQSCLEWGTHNTSRFMTAGGPLGQYGPVITQFHGFVPKIVSAVYRNALDGYTNRLSESVSDPVRLAALRKEARTFTNAHLGSVAALSGVMGLPLISSMLGAATRISGATGGQPTDFQAGVRSFLANTFGKPLGEVISHGLPRYLGTDMSELGDNNWVPFASLIEDRQRWEDASKDYLAHAWGSAVGAGSNFVLAARDMSEGRFMEAGARAMPTSIKNVVRAVQIEQRGYVNSKGAPLPVEGVDRNIEAVKQLLGFQSGQLAEERERQNAYSGLLDDRKEIDQRISQKFMVAQNRGDAAGKAEAIAEAKDYAKDNPGTTPLVSSLGSMVQQQFEAAALAKRTGVLGLKLQDRRAVGATNY